jgi:DNA-binding transcriptional MerR regulator
MPSATLMPIGRFARSSGLSVGALRHYDRHGLLSPALVSQETGYRYYAADQLATARAIALLRDLEMSLPEIRGFLSADAEGRRARLARHRGRLQARADRLHRVLHQFKEIPMTTEAPRDTGPDLLDADTHRRLGVELFNHVWRLLETEERTAEQDDEMTHAAHASRWHWSRSGVSDLPQRLAVGEWQCSRVYAVLGRAEPALHHASRCVDLVEAGGLEDWVAASAYEAMARASSVAGDRAAFETWRARARAAADAISDAEEREVIEGDLATLV